MDDKIYDALENINVKLFVLHDLVNIVIDFIENECPTRNEKEQEEFNLKAVCYAQRSSMFKHSLDAASMMLLDASNQLEEIIKS